ncbi:MAG: IS200/IS605 family accessory protein TnpB-related protein [Nitrososphaerales archaeon]
MMWTINFKIISPDERLTSTLSQYRSMVQYALNYAISKNIRGLSRLHHAIYKDLRVIFNSPARLAIDAMRQVLWVYGRWRKEKKAKRPIIKRKCMVLTPNLSLNFGWDRASILTFEGRVDIGLTYIESYHGRYKDWNLEARLVEKDGLWLRCIFEKMSPNVETEDVIGMDLNFKNITIASKEGVAKIKVSMLRKAIAHKKAIENMQKRHRGWKFIRGIMYAIRRHGKRMRNRVIDRLRKIAKAVVKSNITIALEDLKRIRHNNNGFSKLHLWCYRKLQQAIANENEEHGNNTLFVKARGSSSTCPECGLKLKEIDYHTKICPKCNKIWDRMR